MKCYESITIIAFFYAVVTCSSSEYKGVVWNTKNKKWRASVYWNCQRYPGGEYRDELDAAKRVNQLCDELEIERKNPGVDANPPANVTHFTSKYKGVARNGQLWAVTIFFNSQKIHGGRYCDELDAAKRVNQLCDKLKITQKNPGIGSMPNPKIPIKHCKQGLSSQYRGVCWVTGKKRWKSEIRFENQHNVSYHVNELDAARRVNKWCDVFGMKQKNPEVDLSPNVEESKYLEILESEKLTNMATSEVLDLKDDDIQSNIYVPYQSTTESDEQSNFDDRCLSYNFNEDILQAQQWNLWENKRLGFF